MRVNITRNALATLLGTCLAGLAAPAWSLDLAEAYRLAAARDAAIRGSRSAADAARERLPQARAQLMPSVSISASRFRNDLDSTSPDLLGRKTTTHDFYDSMNDERLANQPVPFLYSLDAAASAAVETVRLLPP